MASPTWTAFEYMTALRDLLRARTNLAGVRVDSAPVSKDDANAKEIITMIDVDTEQDPAAIGPPNRQMEEYTLEGVIQVLKTGKGEDVAVQARDRAGELFAEVELQVQETPDMGLNTPATLQVIRYSSITRKVLRQGIQTNYRRAVVEWEITVKTKIG